jgi:TonB family protein
MRRSRIVLLAVATVASVVPGVRASAQDSVRKTVKLPTGAVITRSCAVWHSEGIVILTADSRDAGKQATAYLEKLAAAMERRLHHIAPDTTALVTSFAARLIRNGAVSDVRLMRPSGREGFDMDARLAADLARGDPILVAMPASVPDSLVVLVSIGRRQDGTDFLVKHEYCPAIPFPSNPAPEYPVTATIWRARATVRVRYTVDSLGAVDSASVTMLDPTSDAFENAVMLYLRKSRYLPAAFDGGMERQIFTRSIVFVPPEESSPASP